MTRELFVSALSAWVVLNVLLLVVPRPGERIGAREVDALLTRAGLAVTAGVRARLVVVAVRRLRWARWGASIGFAAGLLLAYTVLPTGPETVGSYLFSLMCMTTGLAWAQALSGQPAPRPGGQPRLVSLEPHGLGDYVRHRDLWLAAVLVAGGCCAAALGLTMLVRTGDGLVSSVLVTSGLVSAATGVAGLLLERRLLSRARPATDVDQLVADDVALAWGLCDTTGAVLVVAADLAVLVLLWSGLSVIVVLAALVPIAVALQAWTGWHWRPVPGAMPVARRLTAQEVPA